MGLGIKLLDEQHQRLVGIINQLYEIVEQPEPATAEEPLHDIIDQLVDYAYYHFQTEELLFEKYQYPQSFAHISEHKYFTSELGRLAARFANERGDTERLRQPLQLDILAFLTNWLINHICFCDRGFANYLKQQGQLGEITL